MRRRWLAGGVSLLVGAAFVVVPGVSLTSAQTAGGGTRSIPSGGTTSIRPSSTGGDGIQQPEIRPGSDEDEGAGSFNRPRPGFKNGKFPKKPLDAPVVRVERRGGVEPGTSDQLRRPEPP